MSFPETLSLSAIHIPVLSFPLARICLFFLFLVFLGFLGEGGTSLLNSLWLYFSGGADGFLLLFGFGLASPGLFLLSGRTGFLALHT